MRVGLLGLLLGMPGWKRRTLPSTLLAAHFCRPSVEGLETRALPSVVAAPTGLGPIVDPASSPSPPVDSSLDSSGPAQPSASIDQGTGQPDGQAGTESIVIHGNLPDLVEIKLQAVKVVPTEFGQPQQFQGQSPIDNGQVNGVGDAQGGSQGGQSDNSSGNLLDDSQGDQPVDPSQDTGQPAQGDSSDSGASDASGQGDGSAAGSTHDGGHCHRSLDGPSDGQSDTPQLIPGQGNPTNQGSTTGQSTSTVQASSSGQGSTILAPEGKTSLSSADLVAGNSEVASVAELGVGTSTAASNQGSSSEKRQHGSSDASFIEAGQHGPAAVPEGKVHSPDAPLATAEEGHGPVAATTQGSEQHGRGLTDSPSPQQNLSDDPAQRPLAERSRVADGSRGVAIGQTPSLQSDDAVFVGEFSDEGARHPDLHVFPQRHELLTDGLSLDLSSLRVEVQRFFEQIDQLDTHATDRQVGLVFCSVAVVVTAAMACEVAWRQARRPTANSTLALASTLHLADAAEAPVATSLPHFGQFSALS